jgi:hypothetical protein
MLVLRTFLGLLQRTWHIPDNASIVAFTNLLLSSSPLLDLPFDNSNLFTVRTVASQV